MGTVTAEPNLMLGRGTVQSVFLFVALFHLVLLWIDHLPLQTFLVGVGMLVVYWQYLRDYPSFRIRWFLVIVTCGKAMRRKCFRNCSHLMMTIFLQGGCLSMYGSGWLQ